MYIDKLDQQDHPDHLNQLDPSDHLDHIDSKIYHEDRCRIYIVYLVLLSQPICRGTSLRLIDSGTQAVIEVVFVDFNRKVFLMYSLLHYASNIETRGKKTIAEWLTLELISCLTFIEKHIFLQEALFEQTKPNQTEVWP